jgi:hypothetical protein
MLADAFVLEAPPFAENSKTDLKVEALERVHMTPRNLARAYARKRGSTPAKAVDAIP